MSYDVYFEIDIGGGQPISIASRNYTVNVSPMWVKALGGVLLGDAIEANPTAAALQPLIQAAIAEMVADPLGYAAMDPANGWGDSRGALGYLRWIEEMCLSHPKCTVRVLR